MSENAKNDTAELEILVKELDRQKELADAAISAQDWEAHMAHGLLFHTIANTIVKHHGLDPRAVHEL